jgi:thymidylate synthase (FAD)
MQIVKAGFVIESPVDGVGILKNIERFARTCYKSKHKITEDSCYDFVRRLLQVRHHYGILEHQIVTVRFICDRGISHELVRHRMASYLQESTRYCDYRKAGEIQVIKPRGLEGDALACWGNAMRYAEECYNALRLQGVSPQIARSVLPNSLKTEVVATMNLRSWWNFFYLRTAVGAHPQMRELAVPLLAEFRKLIPVVFEEVA